VKKRSSHRPEQVAETIRQVVAEALAQDVRDPRVSRVTVTSVRVTGDLGHARISVVLGDGADPERSMEGLGSAAGFLRARVARALSTRIVPELEFVLDRGAEHAQRMNALLASLREEGTPPDGRTAD
jgi:ribosome-binding factor A